MSIVHKYLIGLSLGALFFTLYLYVNESRDQVSNSLSTYEVNEYGFTFKYPKSDRTFIENFSDERFLRVQNYIDSEYQQYSDRIYWVEFFSFEHLDGEVSCPLNLVDFSVEEKQGFTIYKGTSINGEGDIGAGYMAVCIQREEYDIYIQGTDRTGQNVYEQIVESIEFNVYK